MTRHFCTYFDSRFLIRGLALHRSLRRNAPQSILWVLCLDAVAYDVLTEMGLDGLRPIRHEDFLLGDVQLESARSDRSLVEYYFTCTPSLVLYLLGKEPEIGMITYLDADLYFFGSPEPLFEKMGDCSIALTPHRFPPALHDYVQYGIYNVGWLSFRRDEVARGCLQWWRERCLEWCHDRVEDGKFADQRYLDHWPDLFENVAVLGHPGANLAAWNLATVQLRYRDGIVTANGRPLIFYHFHHLKKINRWMYEAPFKAYGVKPCAILRRHILAPYLRVLRGLEWQVQHHLPVTATEGDLRHQGAEVHRTETDGDWTPRHWLGRGKRLVDLLRGLVRQRYFLSLRREPGRGL